MFPRRRDTSRYGQALRRRTRSLAAVGLVAITSACGDDDAAVFDGARIPAPDPTTTIAATTDLLEESPVDVTTPLPATTTTAPTDPSPTTPATTATTIAEAPTTVAPTIEPTAALPDGGELLVEFTFAPTSTGERIHNPYIAVWVEDLDGNLVDTISLWYQTGGRGTRWLRTLRQWSDLTGEVVDTTSSGATRPAGTYTVAWDGIDADGSPTPAGSYRLFVEAAREDGPYELSSADVTFDGTAISIELPNDGELFDLSARVVA